MRRRKGDRATGDGNTRLVYSTGGDAPAPEVPSPPATGARPGIRLRLERRASGRLVTVVSGLPGSRDEVAALAREIKSACGTGGTVKGGVLVVQGDQRDGIEGALAARGLRSRRAGG
jgi:translation initiation factor 1